MSDSMKELTDALKPKDGGPAFPENVPTQHGNRSIGGMTLRDYFAAKAMQGLLASDVVGPMHEFVGRAYEIADMMLKAREQ